MFCFFCLANLIIKDESLKEFNVLRILKKYYCKIRNLTALN